MPIVQVPHDQPAPVTHATPTAAAPTGNSPGSSFDWTALGIGIGALAVLGLIVGVLRTTTRRSRHPRRQRVAASG